MLRFEAKPAAKNGEPWAILTHSFPHLCNYPEIVIVFQLVAVGIFRLLRRRAADSGIHRYGKQAGSREEFGLRISESQREVFVKPVNTTLPELGEKCIEYAKLHKRSWMRDVQLLANLQTCFGPCKLRDITPLRIEEYQQARVKQDMAPATSNREQTVANSTGVNLTRPSRISRPVTTYHKEHVRFVFMASAKIVDATLRNLCPTAFFSNT